MTILNYSIFFGCTGITTVILPDNVTTIFGSYDADYLWSDNKKGAFAKCTGMKSIIIPENVSTIQEYAFDNISTDKLTVYGVKGSYAEEWAKEKGYSFDIIENYNPNGTTEKVGPKVNSIQVVSPNAGTYKSPQTIQIAVYFSEKITGTTVPTLTIRFGTGTERKVTNGVIKDYHYYDEGKCIIYSYNIQNDDEGQLQTVSLTGGTIKDAKGNDAQLSCPIISGNAIVANKTGIVTNNTENQDKTNNTEDKDKNNNSANDKDDDNKSDTPSSTDKTNTSNNKNDETNKQSGTSTTNQPSSSTNKPSTGKVDPTVANKVLSYTGKSTVIVALIALIVVASIVAFKKYRKYKDIK